MASAPDSLLFRAAADAATRHATRALETLAERVGAGGRDALDRDQRAAHFYAWTATTAASLDALAGWIERLEREGRLGEVELTAARLAFAEYGAQLTSGIPIGPNEIARPGDLGVDPAPLLTDPAMKALLGGNHAGDRERLARFVAEGRLPDDGIDDTVDAVRAQYRRFTDDRILPHVQGWHLADDLIPDAVVAGLAELGTFGITIAPDHGGLGLGKLEMCVVTEELARGWIGTGSLGTRSEIAGDLIQSGGTAEQKARWLPAIASGEVLPTAVFTEPGAGSDLAGLQTKAVRSDDGWTIHGSKLWITHAARSDLMTLLARTDAEAPGHRGLSMMLVPKARGTEDDPFPDTGLAGSELSVPGYRGMREYALSFDGLAAPADALLGGVEGEGFRQLMATFESARIQTAARAVGVARRAFEVALSYALDRRQFGQRLIEFPRVADKLAMMLAETLAARELTYAAARAKDAGRRCDIEAGMAKLLAARVAWNAADAGLQIHGGNGYALESEASRLLADARVLSIFEGAAEIQAQVIARGRLAGRN